MPSIRTLFFLRMFILSLTFNISKQSLSEEGNECKTIHQLGTTDYPVNSTILRKKVWMESVMLKRNILHWKKSGNTTHYSVFLRYKSSSKEWVPVVSCRNVGVTCCNISEIHPLVTYEFKVSTNSRELINYTSGYFLAEYDTTLLPPRFESSRHKHFIEVNPIQAVDKATTKPLLEELTTHEYQVAIWPVLRIGDHEQPSNKTIKMYPLYQSQFVIEAPNSEMSYCISLRYYNEEYEKHQYASGSSEWSKPKCHDALAPLVKADGHISAVAVIILFLTGVLVVFLFVCTLRHGIKRYKRMMKEDKIPENLMNVIIELNNNANMPFFEEENVEAVEKADSVDVERKPNFSPQHVYENDGIPANMHNEDREVLHNIGLEETDINTVWRNTTEEAAEAEESNQQKVVQPLIHARPRKRSSRGYHSDSSDDVTRDYAQTTARLSDADQSVSSHASRQYREANTEQPLVTSVSPQNGNDCYVEHVSPSHYTLMNGWELHPTQPLSMLSKKCKSKEDSLPLQGNPPYENYTYCSNLYGNVPDAFLPVSSFQSSSNL